MFTELFEFSFYIVSLSDIRILLKFLFFILGYVFKMVEIVCFLFCAVPYLHVLS